MDKFVDLKWNSHSSAFLDNLSNLRDQQIYTDVTLSCGNQFYPAHRLVLSSCSSFLSRALEMINCRSPVLLLHGIEQFILEHLLMFMYDGQVTLAQRDLPSFLQAARWLGLKGLDNAEDGSLEEQGQPEFLDGQIESKKYFNLWTQLLSPLVSPMEENPSFDEMTTALRQMVARLENETCMGDMVVSNVTSLSTHGQMESKFSDDEYGVVENSLEPETIIKCENSDIQTEDDESIQMLSPRVLLGAQTSFLDSDDSSESDNNFEGWNDAADGVPNNLRNLKYQLSRNNFFNDSYETSPSGESTYGESQSNTSPGNSVEENAQIAMKRPLRCKNCKITFTVREELAEHLRSHGHNFCFVCNKGFVSSKRYILHMKMHGEGPLHYCKECDFVSQSKRGLAIHWAAMHIERVFEDGNEDRVETNASEVQASVALLTCKICGFRTHYLRGFKRHMTCMHSKRKWKELKVVQDYGNGEEGDETSLALQYNCGICDFSSHHKRGLKRHVTCKHLKTRMDEMDEMSDMEVSQDSMSEAPKECNAEDATKDESTVDKYYCNICHFTSIHKRGFKKHMSCMHDISDFPEDNHFDGRERSPDSTESLVDDNDEDSARIVLRSDKKNYDCPQCNRNFDNYRQFHKHKVLGCGRYRCRYCKKRYRASERKEYIAHQQLHKETETTFNCSYCPYVTDRKRNLVEHINIHTSACRVMCPWCSFNCMHEDVLLTHLESIHGKKVSRDETENKKNEKWNNVNKGFENALFQLSVESICNEENVKKSPVQANDGGDESYNEERNEADQEEI